MHLIRGAAVSGIALVTLGLFAAPAQAAAAGVATVTGAKVVYKAATGKKNKVVLTRSGNTITVDDKVAVKPGKGCKKVSGDKTRVTCKTARTPTRVNVYTYDRNDSVVNKTGLAMTADGGSANDSITGGPRGDTLRGGTGKDKIWGLGGKDRLSGGDGNDWISGGDGADSVDGGEGNDVVYGNNGNDYVDGWVGNDRISGGADSDTLGFYDYEVDGRADNDTWSGGSGEDTLSVYFRYDHAVRVDADGVADDGRSGEKDNVKDDVEVIYGGSKNDRLSGGGQRNVLIGGAGNDVLHGNGGDDSLNGGPGNDALGGGAGNDELEGDDLVLGKAGTDVVRGGAGRDRVWYSGYTRPVTVDLDGAKGDDGQAGEKDTVGADVEDLVGGTGNDRLTGNASTNEIRGGYGNDVIRGGAGDDLLDGYHGRDTVYGEAGDDVLEGQDSNTPDTLDGGVNGAAGDMCKAEPVDVQRSCDRPWTYYTRNVGNPAG